MNNLSFSTGKRKVAIVGVGYVGASIAYALTVRSIAREIVLIDRDASIAQGEALDIRHGVPFMGTSQVYAGDYADCADCDLVILCAGRNRRPGETRRDLVDQNVGIMNSVIDALKPHYTHGAILVVANPVDILTKVASDRMGLPNGRVFGSGCILDTSRLTACIADYLSLSTDTVKAMVLGEHGDDQFPAWSRAAIAGVQSRSTAKARGSRGGRRSAAPSRSGCAPWARRSSATRGAHITASQAACAIWRTPCSTSGRSSSPCPARSRASMAWRAFL